MKNQKQKNFKLFKLWIKALLLFYCVQLLQLGLLAIFNKQVAVEAKVDYWKNRTKRVQDCIYDLVDAIHKQFPKSTIQYAHNDEIDAVEGEIKY